MTLEVRPSGKPIHYLVECGRDWLRNDVGKIIKFATRQEAEAAAGGKRVVPFATILIGEWHNER